MLTASLGQEELEIYDGEDAPGLITELETVLSLRGAPLICRNCGGKVHVRLLPPRYGAPTIRHAIFAHNPGYAEACALLGGTGESLEHDSVKHHIAAYARRNGLPVSIEVPHGNGTQSDVVIGTGNKRTAVEVQMSGLSASHLTQRHQRYVDAMGGSDTAVMWAHRGARPSWPSDVCRVEIAPTKPDDKTAPWRTSTTVWVQWPDLQATRQCQAIERFAYRKARDKLRWLFFDEATEGHWQDVDELRLMGRTLKPRTRRLGSSSEPQRARQCGNAPKTEPVDPWVPTASTDRVVIDQTSAGVLRLDGLPRERTECHTCGAWYVGEHTLCAGKPWS